MIGDQRAGTIQAIPRSDVRQVTVGPPDERAPAASLLSRIVPGDRRFSVRPLEPTLTADGATVVVKARPSARGITPWHVEGWIRLTATDAKGAERRLPAQKLRRGEADFALELKPGVWVITARYTSVTKIAYSEPSPGEVIVVPGGPGSTDRGSNPFLPAEPDQDRER